MATFTVAWPRLWWRGASTRWSPISRDPAPQGQFVIPVQATEDLPLVIPAKAGGAFQQPKAGHPVTLLLVIAIPLPALLQRCRDLAAYAAGVSIGCRRSSHFSFAGPKEK
ncbi:hypothetical protein [Dyella japonica]|uniref:Uncharacterized protein n=1 Tax=Dyella japonica TaxID=231455 RepID=A0ABV2JVV8_9GAMM